MISDLRLWICNFMVAYIPFHFLRKLYYVYIMGFRIGKGSSIHLGCQFNTSRFLVIGENSTINQFCRIDNRGGILIGNNVSISPYVNIITADHDVNHPQNIGRTRKVEIGDFVFIGSDAMILGGVEMKKGSVLGAKSLLTKSTVNWGIYNGIPAVLKSNRKESTNYNSSYIRWFH